jgi:DNA segregation ATPase FtsK/SpoIIIE-like protein
MSRDIGRAPDGLNATPVTAPDASGDAEPEPSTASRPLAPARSNVPVIPVDPDLLRYRHRLDRQLVAWRNSRSATSLANALAIVSPPQAPPFGWRAPLLWIASIAACAVAGLAGWWVASAPAVRIGVELTETRQALQQEQDKVHKLGAALAAMWRELGDQAAALADTAAAQNQERDALQQALQQSEAAAASFAQSLAQERDALQQARQQSEAAASFAQSLAQERDALQQARQQSEAAAASFARSLARERDALQQARQQSEAAAASFARSLAEERERNQQLEQQLASRRDAVPEPVPPAAEPASDKPRTEKADADLLRLMARASLLVTQGDIGAARVVLEHAAESGSASALFALAETFDPAVLSAWGTMGTQGDAARAGDLYAKALAGGVAAAKDRLAALRR